MAVVASGITQVFNLESGLDDKVFEYMDQGKNRTAADALAVKGYANHGTLSGMIKVVIAYQRGRLANTGHGTGLDKISIHDVTEFAAKQDEDFMLEVTKAGAKLFKKFRLISGHQYAAFLFIFGMLNKEQAFRFFEMLATGEGITSEKNSPIYLLRQRLINGTSAESSMRITMKMALIIKAWNLWRKGKELKRGFGWEDDESFPKAE